MAVREHLIDDSHVLRRKVSGNLYAVRDVTPDPYSARSIYGSVSIGEIAIGIGTLGSVVFHCDAIETYHAPEFPGTGIAGYDHALRWSIFGTCLGWPGEGYYFTDTGNILKQYWLAAWWVEDPPESDEWHVEGGMCPTTYDDAIPYSITVSGEFELRCRYGYDEAEPPQEQLLDIWGQYTEDKDPYGPLPATFEYFYVLKSNLSVKFEYPEHEGAEAVVLTIPYSDWLRDGLRAGLGGVECVTEDDGYHQWEYNSVSYGDDQFGNAYQKHYAKIIVDDIVGTFDDIAIAPTTSVHATLDVLTAIAYGIASSGALRYNVQCGPYECNTTGYIKHQDGTPVEGIELETVDGEVGVSNSSGQVLLNHEHTGIFRFGFIAGGGPPEALIGDEWTDWFDESDAGEVAETGYMVHSAPWITNGFAKEEPWFPPLGNTDADRDWSGDWDKRCELVPAEFGWQGALKILCQASREVIAFDTLEGWTVTPESAATFELVEEGTKLKVTVTGDCVISKDYSLVLLRGLTWAGARYADVVYESTDAAPIELEVAGRTYDITPADSRVDVLAIKDSPAVDILQTVFPDVAPTWGWGIHNPGTVKFKGLRAGKTYTFELVKMVKKSPGEGGYIDVLLTDGAFVGSEMGDTRLGDPYSLYQYDDNPLSYLTRKGVVIVDGIVGAELFDMRHVKPGSYWDHTKLQLSSGAFIYPSDGMVELEIGDYEVGEDDWQNGDVESSFLQPRQRPPLPSPSRLVSVFVD